MPHKVQTLALLLLDRKIIELIGTELEKDTPNKKRIDTYIRIILEATETTYNNIFYPTAVQEEKIKAATEKFKLKNIQERAKEQKNCQDSSGNCNRTRTHYDSPRPARYYIIATATPVSVSKHRRNTGFRPPRRCFFITFLITIFFYKKIV